MMKKYVLLLCVCAMVFGKDWPIYKIGIHENVPYLCFLFLFGCKGMTFFLQLGCKNSSMILNTL